MSNDEDGLKRLRLKALVDKSNRDQVNQEALDRFRYQNLSEQTIEIDNKPSDDFVISKPEYERKRDYRRDPPPLPWDGVPGTGTLLDYKDSDGGPVFSDGGIIRNNKGKRLRVDSRGELVEY